MLDSLDPVPHEQPVALVVLNGAGWRMIRLAIDFEDAPSPAVADQEIGLSHEPGSRLPNARPAQRKKQHAGAVERLGDFDFALRGKPESVPGARRLDENPLVAM